MPFPKNGEFFSYSTQSETHNCIPQNRFLQQTSWIIETRQKYKRGKVSPFVNSITLFCTTKKLNCRVGRILAPKRILRSTH